MATQIDKLAFLGFGEAGQAFAGGLRDSGHEVVFSAFDIATNGPEAARMLGAYEKHKVNGTSDPKAAAEHAEIVISLVTADQAEVAAQSLTGTELNGVYFLDCNSCAPSTKRRNAKVITEAGGRYIDVAIMTPVHPKRHRAPCLVSGPHASAVIPVLSDLGMHATFAGEAVGDASTRKMIRSIMVKGMEALTLECFLAAQKAGWGPETLASLEASFDGMNLGERAPYMVERATTHGIRRAAEMEEVAKTLDDIEMPAEMSRATVKWQRMVGELNVHVDNCDTSDIHTLADRLLQRMDAT